MANETRCAVCDFEVASTNGLKACPSCGTKLLPVRPADDVDVLINWGILRTLVMWAERWAGRCVDEHPDMLRLVLNAAENLQAQHPDKAPLTLAAEIAKMRKHFGDVETNLPSVEPRLAAHEAVEEAERLLGEGS